MARVEWTALEGGEAETLLSNLLYNEYGRAVRVRPAQGDYGIDVLVPATNDPEPWDVYQIKKFATNLTDGQKTQVEKSFSRLLVGIVRRDLKINHWYLVMPLDPTPENLTWFAALPETAIKRAKAAKSEPLTDDEEIVARAWLDTSGRQIDCKGLIFCESLAAKFPYVADHYLYGGAERLRNAVDSVASLLRGDMGMKAAAATAPGDGATALLEPREVLEHLKALDAVLDTDPHYTYGHSVEPNTPVIQEEPGLVAATQVELRIGRWLTFKIYQRSAQSLEERPIPIEIKFKFEENSPEHEAFAVWKKFGKPFEANAAIKMNLPGGLGTEAEDALVKVSLPDDGSEFTNRLRVVDPDGVMLAELAFIARAAVGADRTGMWATSADPSGTVETEGFFDAEVGATQSFNFTFKPLAGRAVTQAAPAVKFARHLHAPNRLQIAGSVGPFHELLLLAETDPPVDPLIERLVQALVVIQTRASSTLTIPDMSEFTEQDIHHLLRAGTLISGATVVMGWDKLKVEGVPKGTMEIGGHYELITWTPLVVTLNGATHDLGYIQYALLSAIVEPDEAGNPRPVPHLSDTIHAAFVDQVPAASPGAPAGTFPVIGRKVDGSTGTAEASDPGDVTP